MAVFSRLLPTIATAYAVQSAGAVIFVPQQQDKFYDFLGTIGFLSCTFVSLYYPSLKSKFWVGEQGDLPPLSSFAPRQLLLSGALGTWAVRLGIFLLKRSLKHGGDSRLEPIKKKAMKFAFFWFMQGTWTLLVGLPVYLANTLPAAHHPPLGARDYVSFAIFAISLAVEVIADHQKSSWRAKKMSGEHNEKFIKSGLWSLSRHPNYVGDVGVWTGIWGLATAALQQPFFPRITPVVGAISPLFTWYLLRNLSGVPPLEKSAARKFGDDPKWIEYKRTVPVFWPWGSTD